MNMMTDHPLTFALALAVAVALVGFIAADNSNDDDVGKDGPSHATNGRANVGQSHLGGVFRVRKEEGGASGGYHVGCWH